MFKIVCVIECRSDSSKLFIFFAGILDCMKAYMNCIIHVE